MDRNKYFKLWFLLTILCVSTWGFTSNDIKRLRRRDGSSHFMAERSASEINTLGSKKTLENNYLNGEPMATRGIERKMNEDVREMGKRNPCDYGLWNGSKSNAGWIPINSFICIKLLSGLHTYESATALCQAQIRLDVDTAVPDVMTIDSREIVTYLFPFLYPNSSVTSVWVNSEFKKLSNDASNSLCTELNILNNSSGVDRTHVGLRTANCSLVNSVVCQKTRPVARTFAVNANGNRRKQSVEKDLAKRLDEAEQQLEESKKERMEYNSSISKLEKKLNDLISAVGVEKERVSEKLVWLKHRVGREERNETETKLRETMVDDLVIWKGRVQAYLLQEEVVGNKNLSLGWKFGMAEFEVDKTLGLWNHIELLSNNTIHDWECLTHSYARTNKIIRATQEYIDVDKNERITRLWEEMIDENSPNKWVKTNGYYKWLATDYNNWGIRTFTYNSNNSTFSSLVSRKRTLNRSTLETLRILVSSWVGPTANRKVYDNISC